LNPITHITRFCLKTSIVSILLLGVNTQLDSQSISPDSTQVTTELNSEKNSKRSKKHKAGQKNKGFRASYISILGGAGYYDVIFDPSYGTVGDISPVFGVSYRFESPVNKSIELEMRYRSGGWVSEDLYARDLSILEFPVIAHVSFGQKKTKLFFTLGETVTFIVSEEEQFIDPSSESVFSGHFVNNKVGFALNLGFGVIRHFEKNAIQFEVRGTFTLTNLYKSNNELLITKSNAFFVEGVIKYLFRIK